VTPPEDAAHLRRAFALAGEARARGDEAFGAVLLAADGVLLAEAGNRVSTAGDPTAHAEMAAIRDAARAHGAERLAGATLYASTEPCAMCAAAAYVAGIGRVVFGLREADLPRARGGLLPWLPVQLPAAEVAARGRRPMRVEGPFLEDEAALPHAGLGGGGA
jgi:tRNA(Arg) A34 adenosine deaminase TadA